MLLAAAALGATLFATYCSSCHGNVGQGSSLAPSLIGKPAVDVHFMLDSGRMPAAAPYVNGIPRVARFDEPQITAIVQYVLQLSPQPASPALPLVMPGNIDAGRRLFAENCAQCHGATGAGASVGSNDVAPALSTATVFQVAEAVRAGPGVMPSFGSDVLSDQDLSDIAHYVNYVQTHGNAPGGTNAGGFSLADDGPVAEGFVAWLFGLGALVLFVRFLGTTT
jgi:ubiquinol-cytochrome c reductase cytochrome c subunit